MGSILHHTFYAFCTFLDDFPFLEAFQTNSVISLSHCNRIYFSQHKFSHKTLKEIKTQQCEISLMFFYRFTRRFSKTAIKKSDFILLTFQIPLQFHLNTCFWKKRFEYDLETTLFALKSSRT